MKKIIRRLSSLKLAVVTMLLLAIITAVGTIIESKYDAYAAKKLVYDSIWMYLIMGMLAINLTAVIFDRWPWKPKHSAFIFAHIGILILLFGSVLTLKYGLDGSMTIPVGQSNQFVTTNETDLIVYSSFDGDRYTKLYDQEVDFFRNPPTAAKPFVMKADSGTIEIIDYKKYVIPHKNITASTEEKAGAGVRFQMKNANVDVIEWVVQRNSKETANYNFGPAKIFLGDLPEKGKGKNEIYVSPRGEKLEYAIFHKDSEKPFKKGFMEEGSQLDTGWVGLQLRILRYLPKAKEEWDVTDKDYPTPLTTSAVKVRYKNQEHWALLNDITKFFSEQAVFLVSYSNRRIDLGFDVKLDRFEITTYQGTRRAMAYRSVIEIPEEQKTALGQMSEPIQREIFMNNPLNYKGLWFYQASFQQEDPMSPPTASVLSVNYDPGRFFKYLGSIIMTLGVIMLFYFRKKYTKVNPSL